MGIWDLYFVTKLILFFGHYMGFHVFTNLAFALFLFVPIQQTRLKILRLALAVPIGVALFYHDTWFPPFSGLISQVPQLQAFDSVYLMELLGRFINFPVVAALAVLYVAYFFARKKFSASPLVLLAMLLPLLPITMQPSAVNAITPPSSSPPSADNQASGPATDENLTASLQSFYKYETARTTTFVPPGKADVPFDIIFLHICSLSWDDLNFVKETDNPLFKRFDIVFTNFSSAASYSGPSIIRVLRGSCGQQKHGRLYDPINAQCQTFNNLQQIGFEPQLALNHDGQYGNLLSDIRERGGLQTTPFENKGMPPYLKSFDGTPVSDDYDVLSKWWENRLTLPAERVALYYNSISLHDGNQYADKHYTSSMEIYHPRLAKLLDDLDHFFSQLNASGRHAVVVFVPEHGASIRGDKMQIAGMREIPSPLIGIVPVGIKLVGIKESAAAQPLIVSQPTSHLAVTKLLSDFVGMNPFGEGQLNLAEAVRDLPTTEFVAENEDIIVMRRDNQYYMRSKDAVWVEYNSMK